MKKLILLLVMTTTFTITNAQKHYVFPADSITPYWIGQSEASGIGNVVPRCTVNPPDSLCLIRMWAGRAPVWAGTGYNNYQVQQLLRDTLWTNLPDPVIGTELIIAYRSFGEEILIEIQDSLKTRFDRGDLTQFKYRQFMTDSSMQLITLSLQVGMLDAAVKYFNDASTLSQAMEQEDLDYYKQRVRRKVRELNGEVFPN